MSSQDDQKMDAKGQMMENGVLLDPGNPSQESSNVRGNEGRELPPLLEDGMHADFRMNLRWMVGSYKAWLDTEMYSGRSVLSNIISISRQWRDITNWSVSVHKGLRSGRWIARRSRKTDQHSGSGSEVWAQFPNYERTITSMWILC